MGSVFSRQSFRSAPVLAKCLVASLVFSAIVLLYTEGKTGEMLDRMNDHFRHSRATWSFFLLGIDVYTQPFALTAERVPYPQTWVPWPHHPVVHPPGMFLVFALPAVLGRYATLSTLEFGKIVIAYLCLLTHAAMWAFALVARRVGSNAWMALVGFIWFFSLRMCLLGFYDGVWVLTAALGLHAMLDQRYARAVLWFVASAFISYRAACLAPIAAVAYWRLIRSDASTKTRVAVTLVGTVVGAIVIACVVALVKHAPKAGQHFTPYLWMVLGLCLVVAVATARGASLLVGACVAWSSILAVLHEPFCWHGYVLIAPVLALSLSEKKPLWVQIALAGWFVYALQTFLAYPPFFFFDELARFFANHGNPPRY